MTSEVWSRETADWYDESSADMFEPAVLGPAVSRLASLAAGGPVLELAIGTGRVALPLAAQGLVVSGIELSQPMLDVLRAKPGGESLPVVVGDMSSARAPGEFALVYLVFNTITNLLDQQAQVGCFRNAARHLRPGGRFLVECFVPDLQRLRPGETHVPFDVSEEHVGIDEYDVVAQRLVSHHYWPRSGRTARSSHRYVWPSELDLMASLAGLELESRWADWEGAPLTAESRSHVSVWRTGPR